MRDYLNISECELLRAYQARISFKQLIDQVTIESTTPDINKPINECRTSLSDKVGDHNQREIGLDESLTNTIHSQAHTLLQHTNTHGIPSSVIRAGLLSRSPDYLLAVICVVLWLDKRVSADRLASLSEYGLDYTTICRGIQAARRLQLVRKIRSTPSIGLRYKARLAGG